MVDVQINAEVAVALVDDPDRLDTTGHSKPRLLLELPSCRRFGGLSPFDPPSRELIEAREQAAGSPPLDEEPVGGLDDEDGGPQVRLPPSGGPDRNESRSFERCIGPTGH